MKTALGNRRHRCWLWLLCADFESLSLILFPFPLGCCPEAAVVPAGQEAQPGPGVAGAVRLPAGHGPRLLGKQKIRAQVGPGVPPLRRLRSTQWRNGGRPFVPLGSIVHGAGVSRCVCPSRVKCRGMLTHASKGSVFTRSWKYLVALRSVIPSTNTTGSRYAALEQWTMVLKQIVPGLRRTP